MFEEVTIRKFRCFKELNVEGLKKFNLFVGQNNVGKTTFLEAVFLAAGYCNPRLAASIEAIRRRAARFEMRVNIPAVTHYAESPWDGLFYDFDASSPISIDTIQSLGNSSSKKSRHRISFELAVEFGQDYSIPAITTQEKSELDSSSNGISGVDGPSPSFLTRLSMTTTEGKKQTVNRLSLLSDGTPTLEKNIPITTQSVLFTPNQPSSMEDNSKRYSKLQEVGKERAVIEGLRAFEPRLEYLTVLWKGQAPEISCKLRGIEKMIPLPLMGDGMTRLLSMMLVVIESSEGVALLDELENGIHYSKREQTWELLAEMSKFSNAQIIATTHSMECVVAAYEAFKKMGRTSEFALYRFERVGDDVKPIAYNWDTFKRALESGLEVR